MEACKKILETLAKDGPATSNQLLKKTGLERRTLFRRLKSLVEEGAIIGFIDSETLKKTNRTTPVYTITSKPLVEVSKSGVKREIKYEPDGVGGVRWSEITKDPTGGYRLYINKRTGKIEGIETTKRVRKGKGTDKGKFYYRGTGYGWWLKDLLPRTKEIRLKVQRKKLKEGR